MCNKIYNEVLHLVEAEAEIPAQAIVSKCRHAEVVDARMLVVWFCFKAGMSPRNIADKLGISRQAVCQALANIGYRRANRAFDYIYKRCEARFSNFF